MKNILNVALLKEKKKKKKRKKERKQFKKIHNIFYNNQVNKLLLVFN